MKKKDPAKYFHKYYKQNLISFLKHLKKVRTKPGEENVHHLRVEIKRIRAVFRLLEMLFPEDFSRKKNYLVFRNIFKSAGKLREIHINKKYFKEHKAQASKATSYIKFLNKEELKAKKELVKYARIFNDKKIKILNKNIKELCERMKEEKIVNECVSFIKKEAFKIELLLPKRSEIEAMHEIRIRMKSLGSIAFLLNDIDPSKEFKELLETVKRTETIIGNWHDKEMLSSSLKDFLKKSKNEIQLSELYKDIIKENKKVIKKINVSPVLRIVSKLN